MYAELVCCTNFSFQRGASHPFELVQRAKALGYAALAITDECSLAGIVRANDAATDAGLKLIVGSQFRFPQGDRIVLLAPTQEAYSELCELITRARRQSPKGSYAISREDFKAGVEHCIGLWIPALIFFVDKVASFHLVRGSSMSPTLSQDLVFVQRWRATEDLRRGQVVLFR